MRALIHRGLVVDVKEVDFPVHEDLVWIDCPDDCKAHEWTYDGSELVIPDYAAMALERTINSERSWRDLELRRADIELYIIQDGGSGTVGEWRSYRNDLRNWPEDVLFPDSGSRPTAPDAI